MQNNSMPNGSTARMRVFSVVRARREPKGMVAESASGPAAMGQNVLLKPRGSRGEGGRSVSQRYDEFDHALRVKMDAEVKSVAW